VSLTQGMSGGLPLGCQGVVGGSQGIDYQRVLLLLLLLLLLLYYYYYYYDDDDDDDDDDDALIRRMSAPQRNKNKE